jgi:hypothetical protein
LVARVVDHRTPKHRGARPGRGEHQVIPDLCSYQPPGSHPLCGGIWGRRSNGFAFVCARQGAYSHPIGGATSDVKVGDIV